jgi:hypothetical protein
MAKRAANKRVVSRKPTQKPTRGRRPKKVADWAPAFLGALFEGLHVRDACTMATVDHSTAYQRRKTDVAFAAAWKEAWDLGTEALEHEAFRRAYHGTLKPVFHKGEQCGTIREYSDQLLKFLLRARKPAVYREKFQHEHSGPSGAPLITIVRYRRQSDLPPPKS